MDRRLLLAGGVLGLGVIAAAAGGGLPKTPPGEFFTWEELTTTRHGANPLTAAGERSLRALTSSTLDPYRRWYGRPITVTSGWRSKRINRKVGGAKNSQHMRGEATDFVIRGATSEEIAATVLRSGVPFDQLVWYAHKPHVHVSYTTRYPLRRRVTFSPAPGRYEHGRLPAGAPTVFPVA